MFIFSKFYNFLYSTGQNLLDAVIEAFSHVFFRIYLIINIGFNVLLWLVANYLRLNISQELVILHYNVDFGVDLIGNTDELFVIPMMSLVMIIINVLICIVISDSRHFRIISHMLMAAGIIINIVMLVAFASIYLINFR